MKTKCELNIPRCTEQTLHGVILVAGVCKFDHEGEPNAGINLLVTIPSPGTPGLLHRNVCPAQGFAQQKMPRGWAYK